MKELTNQEFTDVIASSKKPAVIMVKTTHCPSCKVLAPIFEKTGEELATQADFRYLVSVQK